MATPDVKVKVSAEDEGVSTLLKTLSKQLATLDKDQKRAAASAGQQSAAQRGMVSSTSALVAGLQRLATV
jgi:hypothetical protein